MMGPADNGICWAGERRVTVVRSPKSGVNFFSLGDFEEQLEMACVRAQPAIHQVSAPARVHALLRQAWSSGKSDSEAHKPALHPRVVLHAWGNMMAVQGTRAV